MAQQQQQVGGAQFSTNEHIQSMVDDPTSGATDILTALQNAVIAINSLATIMQSIFPQSASVGLVAPTAGAVTFTSSQAAGFYTTTSSSGFTYKVAVY